MRRLGRAVLAATLVACLVGPAHAQVSVDDSALDALRRPDRPAPRARPTPTRPAPARRSAPAATAAKPPAKPAPAAAKPAKPDIPVSPPAILALPPPVVVPLAHPPPAPAIPIADDAPGAATPINGGVRVTFGPDRAELNPATVAALRDFARAQANQPRISITITAYAAGAPDDPSTPRRLSLERALAARAVLLKEGIPSPRIYPRALGPTGGGEPDRVDVTAGPPTPAAQGSAG